MGVSTLRGGGWLGVLVSGPGSCRFLSQDGLGWGGVPTGSLAGWGSLYRQISWICRRRARVLGCARMSLGVVSAGEIQLVHIGGMHWKCTRKGPEHGMWQGGPGGAGCSFPPEVGVCGRFRSSGAV